MATSPSADQGKRRAELVISSIFIILSAVFRQVSSLLVPFIISTVLDVAADLTKKPVPNHDLLSVRFYILFRILVGCWMVCGITVFGFFISDLVRSCCSPDSTCCTIENKVVAQTFLVTSVSSLYRFVGSLLE